MVQIKIKGLNDGLHVYGKFDDEQTFLNTLKERLKAFSGQKKAVEAFFHIPPLSDQSIICLFQICHNCHVLIKGMDDVKGNTMQIKQGLIHNGHRLELSCDTLWLGDIQAGSYVICKGSLYVIGNVEGTIDLNYADNLLAASSISANVRICDTKFQNVTCSAPIKVYYYQRTIMFENVKEELYGRGHSNYVR